MVPEQLIDKQGKTLEFKCYQYQNGLFQILPKAPSDSLL